MGEGYLITNMLCTFTNPHRQQQHHASYFWRGTAIFHKKELLEFLSSSFKYAHEPWIRRLIDVAFSFIINQQCCPH